MKDFKESLEKVIIPGVERMILEEQKHIATLTQYNLPETKEMIMYSMLFSSQLRARLMEYESYLEKLNREQKVQECDATKADQGTEAG